MTDIRLTPSTKVARLCACRGWVVATPGSPEVMEAVVSHQEAEPHRSFDSAMWRAENTTTQPVRTILRRVDEVAA